MKKISLVLLLALFAVCTLCVQAQMNVDRDRYIIDSDRARNESRERELSREYVDLQKADGDLSAAISELSRKQTEVQSAMRRIRGELNSVKLKLL